MMVLLCFVLYALYQAATSSKVCQRLGREDGLEDNLLKDDWPIVRSGIVVEAQ